MSVLTKRAFAGSSVPAAESIESLIDSLGNRSGRVRQDARRSLVDMRQRAVPYLVNAISDPNTHRRWEVAKALGQIGDPRAAGALVGALEDHDVGVRWVAADALVKLGRGGLQPLLRALVTRPDSVWLREGAHRVLSHLAGSDLHDVLAPVLAALDDVEPTLEAPRAAYDALNQLS
jgi:HEAT repeat protein